MDNYSFIFTHPAAKTVQCQTSSLETHKAEHLSSFIHWSLPYRRFRWDVEATMENETRSDDRERFFCMLVPSSSAKPIHMKHPHASRIYRLRHPSDCH